MHQLYFLIDVSSRKKYVFSEKPLASNLRDYIHYN